MPITTINTPTNKLIESQDFYSKLSFEPLSPEKTIFTDGQIVIEIDEDRFARTGIKIYNDNQILNKVENLKAVTETIETDDHFIVSDPNGVKVYLEKKEPGRDLSTNSARGRSTLGNFGGVSIETADMRGSVIFWQTIGFEVTQGTADAGWVTLSNGTSAEINIMRMLTCPHLFFSPGLNYFNGHKNLDVIAQIKSTGIPITEEITAFNKDNIVDNIIIRDPGGLGFFIFSD